MAFTTQLGNNRARGSQSDTLRPALWVGAVVLAIVLTLVLRYVRSSGQASSNRLILGAEYSGPTPYPVSIVVPSNPEPPSLDEILATRKQQMDEETALVASYAPFKPMFRGIDSDREWLSMAQLYYFGTQKPSENVPADYRRPAASQVLFNPLMLVTVEFWGLSIWGPAKLQWNRGSGSLAILAQNKIPLVPRLSKLTYFPDQSRAAAQFNVTEFLQQVKPYLVSPVAADSTAFALSLQNARDFGYGFYYLDLGGSENIKNAKQQSEVSVNLEYVGPVMTSWGGEELVNHLSANNPVYDWITVTVLPARARLKLWLNSPQDLAETADLTYDLIFN